MSIITINFIIYLLMVALLFVVVSFHDGFIQSFIHSSNSLVYLFIRSFNHSHYNSHSFVNIFINAFSRTESVCDCIFKQKMEVIQDNALLIQ